MPAFKSIPATAAALLLIALLAPLHPAWNVQTVDAAGRVGDYTSLAVDSQNRPHISYYSYDDGGTLKYARWTGTSWAIERPNTSATNIGQYSSLALDGNDYPIIGYYHAGPADLGMSQWNGTQWTHSFIDNSAASVGWYCSLKLDRTNGNPRAAYFNTTDDGLVFASWNSVSWDISTVDTAGIVGEFSSLALDAAGNPHIAYYDQTNRHLKYAAWNGSAWSVQTVDTSTDTGRYASIAIDRDDRPRIAYFHRTGGFVNGFLKCAAWNGSSWVIQTVDASGWSVGTYASIAVDSRNRTHIAYYADSFQNLRYATDSDGSWYTTFVDTAPRVGMACSLALDVQNTPLISYFDDQNGDLRFARYVPRPGVGVTPASLATSGQQGGLQPSTRTITVTNSGDPGSTLSWTATESVGWMNVTPMSGDLARGEEAVVVVSFDITGLAAGVYTATITVSGTDAMYSPQHIPVSITITTPGLQPSIQLSLSSMTLLGVVGSSEPATQAFTITNNGSTGSQLAWELYCDDTWLLFSKVAANPPLGRGQSDIVTCFAYSIGLSTGVYRTTVTIADQLAVNSPQSFIVTFIVGEAQSSLAVTPSTLTFTAYHGQTPPAPRTFTVTNNGTPASVLSWTAVESADWLTLSATSGTLGYQQSASVAAAINLAGLSTGTYTHTVQVTAPGALNSPRTVLVILNYQPPIPVLNVSADSLDFGKLAPGQKKTLSFSIVNSGGGTMSGSLASDRPWISVQPTSFSGNNVTVNVTVDAGILNKTSGQYSGSVNITTAHGQSASVVVRLTATCVLPRPNPFNPQNGPITFFGNGIVPYDTVIRIYTVAGDLVRTLRETAGASEIPWDGRNERGDMVVPGMYLYTSESPTEKYVGKLTVTSR